VAARIEIERTFPGLRIARWQLRSPTDRNYNCHAWAACDSTKRWEPSPDWYWPISNQEYTVDGFIEGYATLGYSLCDNPNYEVGFQKIAIYTVMYMGIPDFPSHTARQHVFGKGWLSKLGNLEDIMHPTLTDLNTGLVYGKPAKYLKRSWWSAITKSRTFHCGWVTFKFWRHRKAHPLGG
jgi:hypothetical protein